MIKNFLLNKYKKSISRLTPEVNINLTSHIPIPSAKEIASLAKIVSRINSLEENLTAKEDSYFREKTQGFKKRISAETEGLSGEALDSKMDALFEDILPEAFALVRESARRTIGLRHFDVQILGGIFLHKKYIAEMATGEGKTLVATLAAYLNALAQKGVHIVTVNDYLARRDSDWMGPVYRFLGLSVGVIQQDMTRAQRQQNYGCDITYGTNNEFGFDYLRDNMVTSLADVVQRGHFYAIVDEVDSILIDEARTPLIISGPAEISTEKYYAADKIARRLRGRFVSEKDEVEAKYKGIDLAQGYDYFVDEKNNSVSLTEEGIKKCEQILGVKDIYEDFQTEWFHHITQALRAHNLYKRDKDYVIKEGKVIIVDEFTGRLMPGRRWSDGLHQAIEAKEGLKIQEETQTLATVTLQNYFKMYKKLAGMTGTAYTEAQEFKKIYNLNTVVIPTNRPLARNNYHDRIYKTSEAKFNAIVREIEELYSQKRPVLVGTTSIEKSEKLAFLLAKKGIKHNVLNAKHHEKEAYIVAQAGRLGQVTIATNMAGRGTDIILGGNIDFFIKTILGQNNIKPGDENYQQEYQKIYAKYKDKFSSEHNQVVKLGGLHVIGTERHESRRIDNQLRGRAGRQGDPGSSRFYVSLEDDLMRLFGSERIYFIMDKLGFPEDEPIEHSLISRSIESAQKKVESSNFEARRQLLEYDNVMNKQRELIYRQRRHILEAQSIKEEIMEMIKDVVSSQLENYFSAEEKDNLLLKENLRIKFGLELSDEEMEKIEKLPPEAAIEYVFDAVYRHYQQREEEIGSEDMRQLEKSIALWVIDSRWKEHLLTMDSLREGIHLRSYAQANPLVSYQRESYLAFSQMNAAIKESIVDLLLKANITPQKEVATVMSKTPKHFQHQETSTFNQPSAKPAPKQQSSAPKKKVGRNDPCPCGSGKKYKKCCGR